MKYFGKYKASYFLPVGPPRIKSCGKVSLERIKIFDLYPARSIKVVIFNKHKVTELKILKSDLQSHVFDRKCRLSSLTERLKFLIFFPVTRTLDENH